ncbi:MAG: hypothetical protein KatS3mg029_0452 [Saprospiraceae bacterium]|nr:MAG: hypothetical protein KatS3mg029_0452 [Saprospiraceae bacterium]
MIRTCLIACLLLVATVAGAQHIKRLLLFAHDSTNSELQRQLEVLRADSAGIVAHNIWIAVFDAPRKMRRVYEYHRIGGSPFTLVLVGNGGEEWFRSEAPVEPRVIYQIIERKEQTASPPAQRPKGNSP